MSFYAEPVRNRRKIGPSFLLFTEDRASLLGALRSLGLARRKDDVDPIVPKVVISGKPEFLRKLRGRYVGRCGGQLLDAPMAKAILGKIERRHRLNRLCEILARAEGTRSVFLEHQFHPERRWRLDVAVHSRAGKFGIEIQGLGGRHQRTGGFVKDIEKHNAAVAAGYVVVYLTWKMIETGDALVTLASVGIPIGGLRVVR